MAVFIGLHISLLVFVIVQSTTGFESRWEPWGLLTLVMAACQIHHSRAAAHGRRARGWPVTFGLLIATVILLMVIVGVPTTNSNLIVVAASAAMLLPGRYPALWTVPFGVIGMANAIIDDVIKGDPNLGHWWWWAILYYPTVHILGAVGLAVSGNVVHQVRQLQRSRVELAESAVQRERLRVARDLHDLLGQSLSAVVLKSELAMRLQESDPDRARREVEDLGAIAGTTLADLRAVTRDHRNTGIDGEMKGAARLLDAAGVRAEVQVELGTLPPAVDRLLGWTLREGITNVLRHSDATWCTIRAVRKDRSVLLEIVNDRPAVAGERGSGLAGLDGRARELGGKITTVHGGDQFALRLEVPAEAS